MLVSDAEALFEMDRNPKVHQYLEQTIKEIIEVHSI
jgi:hypothetical protein